MITKIVYKIVTLSALIGGLTTAAVAQDNSALLNILVKKGILTSTEASELKDELAADAEKNIVKTVSGGKKTTSISIYGRLQAQYVNFDTDAAGVDSVNHLFARRTRLGVKTELGDNWVTDFSYEFGAAAIDKLVVGYRTEWEGMPMNLDFGVRKVNFGLEENTSSGSLKSIERSGATRYFVEPNNGRRLGAGKQRVGVFLDANSNARGGKESGVYYGASVTNPELPAGVSGAISAGSGLTNELAYWVDGGYSGVTDSVSYRFGAAAGLLPSQGGRQQAEGSDLQVFSLYGDIKSGAFRLMGEYLSASIDDGIGAGSDASPWGVWIQPSYVLDDNWELVARASYVDSDGRGIKVSDGVRSAPASMTGDNLTEVFIGFNYYIIGSDLKIQTGYVQGWSERNGVEETANGLRSMIAVNF